jgi:hypothetical protein
LILGDFLHENDNVSKKRTLTGNKGSHQQQQQKNASAWQTNRAKEKNNKNGDNKVYYYDVDFPPLQATKNNEDVNKEAAVDDERRGNKIETSPRKKKPPSSDGPAAVPPRSPRTSSSSVHKSPSLVDAPLPAPSVSPKKANGPTSAICNPQQLFNSSPTKEAKRQGVPRSSPTVFHRRSTGKGGGGFPKRHQQVQSKNVGQSSNAGGGLCRYWQQRLGTSDGGRASDGMEEYFAQHAAAHGSSLDEDESSTKLGESNDSGGTVTSAKCKGSKKKGEDPKKVGSAKKTEVQSYSQATTDGFVEESYSADEDVGRETAAENDQPIVTLATSSDGSEGPSRRVRRGRGSGTVTPIISVS